MKTLSTFHWCRASWFASNLRQDEVSTALQSVARFRLLQSFGCVLLLLAAAGFEAANAATGVASVAAVGPLTAEVIGGIYSQIEQSEYEIHWQESAGAYMAPNRAHNLRFTFHDDGLTVTPRTQNGARTPWVATLSLDSYGRAGFPAKGIGEASWTIIENTAEVQGDGITID
jgi:hypothetical protein